MYTRRFPRPPLRCVATSSTETKSDGSSAIAVGKLMSSKEIRETFLQFFEKRGHQRRSSASLVPSDPTILLTIAGMVPFKPIFMGASPRPTPPRACSSQKCVRTNDIENVGVTKRHHTFFEMLGNFSFGDYFKSQAITWAWELLTVEFGIPKERLAISVFEDDDEAFKIWTEEIGLDPRRVVRMGSKDNFWAAGPTGPCGPCSEVYYDFRPNENGCDLEDDERFLEVYNLVFMQYSRDSAGKLTPLKEKNIDTGMGLERMAQVLQRVETNYETDLIRPIINEAANIVGMKYEDASEKHQISLKVVGDHCRAIAHLISDGVRPSNIGRGYVVRRLIRRVVRHGRLLGIDGPFIAQLLPVVKRLADEAGLVNVAQNYNDIERELIREERRFLQTLQVGELRLDEVFEKGDSGDGVNGEVAFELYDTFGFPLELTQEIAAEKGWSVDVDGFNRCMEQQRKRARAARGGSDVTDTDAMREITEAAVSAGESRFVGYEHVEWRGNVSALIGVETEANVGDKVRVLLDETPFYAEGGGQVGDTGFIRTGDGAAISIKDTVKEGTAHVHLGTVTEGVIRVGDEVEAVVNAARRRRIVAHHTATHLLQAALKVCVDEPGIAQAGSLVDADRLRFDFSCGRAITNEEIEAVENLVNKWVNEAHDTVVDTMPIKQATAAGAVAMFGEKYDDVVRVVDVPGVSMELCGGTHVRNTAEIALFKILSETGPAAGVRRIEAVCGAAALPTLQNADRAVKSIGSLLRAPTEELPERVVALMDKVQEQTKQLAAARNELAMAKANTLMEKKVDGEAGVYVVSRLSKVNADSLKAAALGLGERLGGRGVVVLATNMDGKVAFCAVAGKDAVKSGVSAGKLVGKIAKICGGGGGGKNDFAQAGGRDASKIDEALGEARKVLDEALGVN